MTNSMQQTRAVCCQCGNPRTVSVHWHRRTHRRARDLRDDMEGTRRYPGADKYWRFVCRAKCPHCAKITPPSHPVRPQPPLGRSRETGTTTPTRSASGHGP
jgi:hypothetical protein